MNRKENIDYINSIHDTYIKELQKQDKYFIEENQELKKQLDGIIEERDYLFNKLNTENKWLIVGNKKLRKKLEVGEEQYNDLVEEKEELQEQLSIKTLQLEEIKISKRDYTQENILEMKLTLKENQQKLFIEYLEQEKDRLSRECSQIYEDSLGKTRLVSEDIFNEVDKISIKFKEIIGGKDEKE